MACLLFVPHEFPLRATQMNRDIRERASVLVVQLIYIKPNYIYLLYLEIKGFLRALVQATAD